MNRFAPMAPEEAGCPPVDNADPLLLFLPLPTRVKLIPIIHASEPGKHIVL